MSSATLLGIHHVTAVCGDAQQNVNFYTNVLGLRLVKVTVNFDDPSVYHLYYGDEKGSPGTILTFFSYPKSQHGARGAGTFNSMTFAVPPGSLEFWFDRLTGRDPEWYINAHGERSIIFEDPDGLRLAMVEVGRQMGNPWTRVIEASRAIKGIAGVCLGSRTDHSKKFFTESIGLPIELESAMHSGQMKTRLQVGPQFVDIMPTTMRSMGGKGTYHHVAFGVADQKVQSGWLGMLQNKGHNVSPVRDRTYFHSIYFRETGGALCEIATDRPGFTVDEPIDELGTTLRLPSWMMRDLEAIQKNLPPLKVPGIATNSSV